MANLVEQAKRQIDELLAGSLARAAEKGQLPSGAALAGTVEVPKEQIYHVTAEELLD